VLSECCVAVWRELALFTHEAVESPEHCFHVLNVPGHFAESLVLPTCRMSVHLRSSNF
jgi:hypothetical protein